MPSERTTLRAGMSDTRAAATEARAAGETARNAADDADEAADASIAAMEAETPKAPGESWMQWFRRVRRRSTQEAETEAPQRSGRFGMAVGACGVLILAAGVIYWAMFHNGTPDPHAPPKPVVAEPNSTAPVVTVVTRDVEIDKCRAKGVSVERALLLSVPFSNYSVWIRDNCGFPTKVADDTPVSNPAPTEDTATTPAADTPAISKLARLNELQFELLSERWKTPSDD